MIYTTSGGLVDWSIHSLIKGMTFVVRCTLLVRVLLIDCLIHAFIYALKVWLWLEDVDCLWGSCWSIDWLINWLIKGVTFAGRCTLLQGVFDCISSLISPGSGAEAKLLQFSNELQYWIPQCCGSGSGSTRIYFILESPVPHETMQPAHKNLPKLKEYYIINIFKNKSVVKKYKWIIS